MLFLGSSSEKYLSLLDLTCQFLEPIKFAEIYGLSQNLDFSIFGSSSLGHQV